MLKEEHLQGTAKMLDGGTRLKKGRDRLETSGSQRFQGALVMV